MTLYLRNDQGGVANDVPVGDENPVPVKIMSGGEASVAYAAPPSAVAVTTSNTSLVAAGAYSNILVLQTAPGSAGNVWLNLAGGAAASGQGIYIPANGGTVTLGNVSLPMPSGAINGISDNGTVSVSIQGA